MTKVVESLIFELSSPGRTAVSLPVCDVPETEIPKDLMRDDLPLPEVSEVDLFRHYVRLSQLNWGVDKGMYPLGSCTMKYNPKVNEVAARLPGFTRTHPYQDHCSVQGNLQLVHRLQEYLKDISGFAAVTLQPSAGAHGEFVGILVMRAYHHSHGDTGRTKILIPDSAHGTNPASTTMSGLQIVEIPSDPRGNVDLAALKAHCDDTVVGLMLTNPNTLGLFEEQLLEVTDLIHGCGGLVYGDGANLNAILGVAKPATLGFDVMHFNLHKTFSTPHGGGGPGSGPVGVSARLARFLPGPVVVEEVEGVCDCGHYHDDEPCYHLVTPEASVGRVKAFYGNFGVMVRAYTYIRMLGAEGMREVAENAVLNANYLQARLKDVYPIPHGDRICMHEFVAQGKVEGAEDVRALDIAKRLMDLGHSHPPTVYFPLIVPEALMIEPTETESKETLEQFVADLFQIAEEAQTDPDLLHGAPYTTPVGRLDEVRAARQPVLRWTPPES
ncbi:MAG: aminomethyl-transferring glycine dehydrogenase subunit GcvPB [Anaerolineae bacterium]|nr:MAG: aminomethyl-transferring glycine dehydrogenase subunit GcvPB [Anaerolineae bacterium]